MRNSDHTHRIFGLALPIAFLILMSSGAAQACGESRYRLGHGIRYETYQAPMPATVLIYQSADYDKQTAGLQSAGHQITFVSNQDQLLKALDEESYDVVIAPYGDMAAVEEQIANILKRPGLLPVIGSDANERRSAKSQYHQYLKSGASLRKIARAIHNIMKNQLQ